MGMPMEGNATVIYINTLHQRVVTDIQASVYSSIRWCYIMLTGKQLLKSWAAWCFWSVGTYLPADMTSHPSVKKQRSHSLVPPNCLILLDSKQPILHQNMNQTINETDVTVHSAQPTLLPQVPVLCIARCYMYIVPGRHLHVYALSYLTGQSNKFTYLPTIVLYYIPWIITSKITETCMCTELACLLSSLIFNSALK